MNIICFGFGQVAKNFIKKLKDQGATFKLTTTSREESTTKEFENITYESFQFTKEGFDKNFLKSQNKKVVNNNCSPGSRASLFNKF